MTEEELKKLQAKTGDHISIVSIAAEIIMEEKGEDKDSLEFQCGLIKDYCLKIRQDVAGLLEAYKDLRRQIRSLADKQEMAYKEHIKKEYTNII